MNAIPTTLSTSEWGVQDSNLRRHSHQIYSLTPLTARETPLLSLESRRQILTILCCLSELGSCQELAKVPCGRHGLDCLCDKRLPNRNQHHGHERSKDIASEDNRHAELAEGLEPTTC